MSSVEKKCAGCLNALPKKDFLSCCVCKLKYDLECANVSNNHFNLMERRHKAAWKCPECISKQPKTDNSHTPVRSTQKSPNNGAVSPDQFSNITLRTKATASSSSNKTEATEYMNEEKLRVIINQELTSCLQLTIKQLVTAELQNINSQISVLNESAQFLSNRYEEIKQHLNEKDNLIKVLKLDNELLKTELKSVTARLDLTEQHLRECNLEINGIPEHRSENLTDTLIKLTAVIDCPLQADDIHKVTRVAKVNNSSNRPRSIVVKLRSQRTRDTILAGTARFNKKQPDNKLNSLHLGLPDPRSPIFVSEHLSPANKALHAAARRKAKETSCKFVWIRNGRVYVRRNEFSQAICIKNSESKFN